jgi:hypothetical protein
MKRRYPADGNSAGSVRKAEKQFLASFSERLIFPERGWYQHCVQTVKNKVKR